MTELLTVTWENGRTPINAENLNKMQSGVLQCAQEIETIKDSINGVQDVKSTVDVLDSLTETSIENIKYLAQEGLSITYDAVSSKMIFKKNISLKEAYPK